jgi:hypothetical protein
MSDGEFFGGLTRQAEIDLCAADYLRRRVELASASVQEMLDGLETLAQDFLSRGQAQIRSPAEEDTPHDVADAESEVILKYITNHLARTEPGPDRIALCNRMIVEAGASDDLQTILWLIGEKLVLPAEQGHDDHAQARSPARSQPQRQPLTTQSHATTTSREPTGRRAASRCST